MIARACYHGLSLGWRDRGTDPRLGSRAGYRLAGDPVFLKQPAPDDHLLDLRRALADREELVLRGLDQARRFSWLETGRIHLQSYADAL